jgi:ubiquinone/menaquinone biosynthesis C-methylase UbiE
MILLIKQVKHNHILDLGCGEGFDLKNILEKGELSIEYCFGFDLNIDALRFANKMLAKSRFNAVNGDIYNLPFNLRQFNTIFPIQ